MKNRQVSSKNINNDTKSQSLTQLLQTTDFALQDIRIRPPKKQLYLDAQASSGTTFFSYTLRVDLNSINMSIERQQQQQQQQQTPAVVLGPAAVRFQTSALLGNISNPWLQSILPDVYLPVGPGIALLLPRHHHDVTIRTIPVVPSEAGYSPTTTTPAIELCGHRSFFPNPSNGEESSLVLRQEG
jgi:hypothetical protein